MAHWYVLKSASGSNNGLDWDNAWHEMEHIAWGSIAAGDTIWLGGGTYTTTLSPTASGTSDNRIYIKRVRTTDTVPVAATGWNASFDAQVIIDVDNGICWNNGTDGTGSYITIDGRIDSGIKSISPGLYFWSAAVFMDTGNTGVVIQYVDCVGPGGATKYTHAADCKAVRITTGSGRGIVENLTMRYCRMHGGVDQLMIVALNGGLFEYNTLYDNQTENSETYHPGTVACTSCNGTITYRYNTHYNLEAEGILLGPVSGANSCRWDIYGNLAYNGLGGSYRFLELAYYEWEIYVYNNTVADMAQGVTLATTDPAPSIKAGSAIKNNIFYNVTGPFTGVDAGFRDYNALSGTNTETNGISNMPSEAFTDYANQDFTIVGTIASTYPRDKGVDLGSNYNIDILGVTRPQGSAWDMGAYEYQDNDLVIRMTVPSNQGI